MKIVTASPEGMIAEEYEILPADLIFTRGASPLFGKFIRWFERSPGEEKTFAGHVGGIGSDSQSVVEALWKVTSTPYHEWAKSAPQYEIWRHYGLAPSVRHKIAAKAESYIGRDYGWWKLGAHAGDAMLTKATGKEVFIFRKALFLDEYPICSWVWAYAYAKSMMGFGIPAHAANPDDMHDYVKQAPEWGMVMRGASCC
jgi:hypothetical protein